MWSVEDRVGVKKIEAVLFEIQMTFSFIPLKVHFGLCTLFVSIVKPSFRQAGYSADASKWT